MILFRRALVHLRLENLFGLPERGDLLDLAPQPRRKAREKGRAKGGRLDHARAVYGLAEDIRLELHEEIADGGAAVHAQDRKRPARVQLHGVQQVLHLVGDALHGGADYVRTGRTAGEADHRASGIHVPVRRAQAREGRDEVDPAVIRHAGGDGPALCGGGDEAHLIAQPLYRAAGVEHAALKGIGRTAAEAPATLVSMPERLRTLRSPVFISVKQPVP